jgi:hypothetical protein
VTLLVQPFFVIGVGVQSSFSIQVDKRRSCFVTCGFFAPRRRRRCPLFLNGLRRPRLLVGSKLRDLWCV